MRVSNLKMKVGGACFISIRRVVFNRSALLGSRNELPQLRKSKKEAKPKEVGGAYPDR